MKPIEDAIGNPGYLAKDYASFRQLMLDHMAVAAPDWVERHTADLGVTLIETLASAADYVSYFQDAVSTETYLKTAPSRRRPATALPTRPASRRDIDPRGPLSSPGRHRRVRLVGLVAASRPSGARVPSCGNCAMAGPRPSPPMDRSPRPA